MGIDASRTFAAAALLSTLVTSAVIRAQAPPENPAPVFDVVSVKESPSLPVNGSFMVRPGSPDPSGRWSAVNAQLRMILQRAFPDFALPGMIVDAPAWVDERRFDIEARAEVRPEPGQYPGMLQRLLADRFKLKTHVEQRPVEIYSLILARDDGKLGPRLEPASEQCLAEIAAERERLAKIKGPVSFSSADIGPCGRKTGLESGNLHMVNAGPLSGLATGLQAFMDKRIVDRTGLKGVYRYDLEFDYAALRSTNADTNATGLSVFTAVQEQLGLKLDRRREPTDVLVVDSVEMPTAN